MVAKASLSLFSLEKVRAIEVLRGWKEMQAAIRCPSSAMEKWGGLG